MFNSRSSYISSIYFTNIDTYRITFYFSKSRADFRNSSVLLFLQSFSFIFAIFMRVRGPVICSSLKKHKKTPKPLQVRELTLAWQLAIFAFQLSSPLDCLTAVCGMVTGVASLPSPPDLWIFKNQKPISMTTSIVQTNLSLSLVIKPSTY